MTQHLENSKVGSVKFKKPIHCDKYLVDGVLHAWKGNTSKVYSTIQSEDKDGAMNPTLLGSIPDMETDTWKGKEYVR